MTGEKWNYIQSGICVCPFCGAMPHKIYKNYCAKCGANMKKEDCGKWIFHKDFNDSIRYGCNQCGNLTNIPSNFCPNCGAKMETGARNVK